MIRPCLLLVLLASATAAIAAAPSAEKVPLDPLEIRWTFGNHEPLSMYRRTGGPSTGGVEGSSQWLEDWHHWFDSEACPATMQELGLNMIHCRFYKGMGWDFESKDFPNVKQLVNNCHKHGVRALAYVQFSTLYYEVLQNEIPDLADWASVDERGAKRTFGSAYYRWMPCINAPGFEPYLAKMVRIAMEEGGFDGVMFDNCHVPPCYCKRCQELFREHLAQEADPERRFGVPNVKFITQPIGIESKEGQGGGKEVRDPITQRWIAWRCQRLTDLFRRLFLVAKASKPSAIFSGNVGNIRRSNMGSNYALNITDLKDCFDILVSQSGNEPCIKDGYIVNRVREMKLAQAMQTHILALSDLDAGISADAEAKYSLNLLENAMFGAIPFDRMVMKADPEMVSRKLIESRKPLLSRFNETVKAGRAGLAAPSYQPVRLLYSRESLLFSEQAYKALATAEEILLRNHLPYGLLITDAHTELTVPDDCQLLLVCDQKCLSDAQVASLDRFVARGGRMVVTGESGQYDAWYCQRRVDPMQQFAGRDGVVLREQPDVSPTVKGGWTISVAAPKDGGRRLVADMAKVWAPAVRVQAPATTFVEVKRSGSTMYVHLLNYDREAVREGSRIELSGKEFGRAACTFAAPMEGHAAAPLAAAAKGEGRVEIALPAFSDYAVVSIQLTGESR